MIALLALVAATQADLPPGATEASTALSACAVRAVEARYGGPDPAEVVVDAAFAECSAEMQRLYDAFDRGLGALSAAERQSVVAPARVAMVRRVNELRGVIPRQQNEVTRAGDCIVDHAPRIAARPGPPEGLVDLLVRQCDAEIAALRANLVQERGEASADRIMPSALNGVRSLARDQLRRARGLTPLRSQSATSRR